MARYIVKRLCSMLLTLFLIATITFFLMHSVSGQPFQIARDTPEIVREALNEKYGLDKPLLEQYVIYMKNLLKGDFGISMKYKGRSVIGKVADEMPVSAIIGFGGVAIGCLIGCILGIVSAMHEKKFVDYFVIVLAVLGVSVPNFVFGSLIQRVFAVQLHWFPIQGWRGSACAVLPVLAASFGNIAYFSRMLRSSMLDVTKQDYIYTARSKGLSEREVMAKHALRNAVLPLVTALGPMLTGVLTGNFVIEKIFNIPGIGQTMINAINSSDYTMIMGLTVIFAFISVVCYFIVDIVYGLVDPRIRMTD